MNLPPVVQELIDKPRRVLWVFRASRPVSDMEMEVAIGKYLNENGEPQPNQKIDVIIFSPPLAG